MILVANAGIGEWCMKYAPTNGSAGLGFFCSVERAGILDDSVFFEFLRAALG